MALTHYVVGAKPTGSSSFHESVAQTAEQRLFNPLGVSASLTRFTYFPGLSIAVSSSRNVTQTFGAFVLTVACVAARDSAKHAAHFPHSVFSMQNRLSTAFLLGVAGFLLLPRPAQAQMSLTYSNPNVSIGPGGTVTFNGSFTNTSATDTYEITGFQLNNVFFMNGATQLSITNESSAGDFLNSIQYAPGGSYNGAILSLALSPSAALGYYPQLSGFYAIQFQTLDVTTGNSTFLIPGPSNASVTVVPEPSEAAFLTVILGGLGGIARPRWRRRLSKLVE